MSAPDTNIEKQADRHKGPLVGMPMAVIVAVLAMIAVAIYMLSIDPADTAAPQVIQGAPATNSGS